MATVNNQVAKIKLDVAIIGAGIGGLAAAISCARKGMKVTVYEAASAMEKIGAGLIIGPNMSRILKRWGIIDGLAGEAIVIKDVTLRRYANDTELTRVSLPNVDCIKDSTMLSVHRGDLQLAMKNAAEAAGAEINLASGVEDIDFENTRFKIKGHSNWIQKDVIIAADGLKSIVRTKILALHGDTEKVKQTGDGVSRIVISAEQIYNSNDAELIELLESPTQFRWIGPGGQIVCYPVCNHKILYVGLGHPQKEDTEELWITKRDKKELLDYYGIWHTRAKKLLDYLPDGEVLEWKVHDHKDLPRWIENKVALMGDAAHPMLPYTAQGAAQAIEDAVVLSVCLSMIDSREQVDLALKVYQLVRKPRASILQRSTAQLQKTLHLHDGPEQQSRDEKMFNAIKTGSNPDVFSDTSFQNWCWGTDIEQKTMDMWDQLLKAAINGQEPESNIDYNYFVWLTPSSEN